MKYTPLIKGKLLKRYKRFFVDVLLDDGQTVIAHCVNTGSMLSCLEVGAEVALSISDNPKRKLKYTFEMIKIKKTWVGVNTVLANKLAEELIQNSNLLGLNNIEAIAREVKYNEHTRFDFLITNNDTKTFLEVKNVSMVFDGKASFPDAKSERGTKHLNELQKAISEGYKAIMLYICQRDDAITFSPAENIDPLYASTLKLSVKKGVQIIAVKSKVSIKENKIYCRIPIEL